MTYEAVKPVVGLPRRVLYRGPFAGLHTADGTLLTPGSVHTLSGPLPADLSDLLFELDPDGHVTNADMGGSTCCSSPPADAAKKNRASPCCSPSSTKGPQT